MPHTCKTLKHINSLQPQFCKQFHNLVKVGFKLSQQKELQKLCLFYIQFILVSPPVSFSLAFKTDCLCFLLLSSHFPLVFNSRSPVQSMGKSGWSMMEKVFIANYFLNYKIYWEIMSYKIIKAVAFVKTSFKQTLTNSCHCSLKTKQAAEVKAWHGQE